ncbi:tRNA (adenine22-N1)-methyltransferase [Lentibacillus persicus]|uniref:tRNA (Adenine22-N1)-methyltransferase n=1 Tax=Lentibacillus persicus TaxID=640948 RepID=A0A1I1TEQ2_9BACI|nr:class I SAM-dependent methyltransferase [Lentibacillus persicus]SFD54813.1 tRNA (adenine22-N1)-methyltransferase [Lentibacillus persicus]
MTSTVKLSRRLQEVAAFIPEGTKFADIGSDHAYLPCFVCLNDKHAKAIAGEVNEGPWQSAQNAVQRFDLQDRIEVRLGNGLQILNNNEVNLVVIAGMGGALIKTILEEGKSRLGSVERIIVQPNVDERNVRYWFSTNGYSISKEKIIEENGHIYEIIIADKHDVSQELTERQLLFGPCLLNAKTDLFKIKWNHEYKKRMRVIEQMKRAESPNYGKLDMFKNELDWIEEVLHDGSRDT